MTTYEPQKVNIEREARRLRSCGTGQLLSRVTSGAVSADDAEKIFERANSFTFRLSQWLGACRANWDR